MPSQQPHVPRLQPHVPGLQPHVPRLQPYVPRLQPYGAHHLAEALLASILLCGALHEPLERGHERGAVLGGREVVARRDPLEERLRRAGWVGVGGSWVRGAGLAACVGGLVG